VSPAIIAVIATAAVLADLRRRFVVVAIINSARLFIFIPAGWFPLVGSVNTQPCRYAPLVQSFAVIANGA
jgi:hypothetical protein